jgi:hypothetical protein
MNDCKIAINLLSWKEPMVKQYELLEKCGFFKKFKDVNKLACRGFINKYCEGSYMNQCKRKEFREQHGTTPRDDMIPNGMTYQSI